MGFYRIGMTIHLVVLIFRFPSLSCYQALKLFRPLFIWIQDERELKRQRRKQSNRESARRSRLRKQVIVRL